MCSVHAPPFQSRTLGLLQRTPRYVLSLNDIVIVTFIPSSTTVQHSALVLLASLHPSWLQQKNSSGQEILTKHASKGMDKRGMSTFVKIFSLTYLMDFCLKVLARVMAYVTPGMDFGRR